MNKGKGEISSPIFLGGKMMKFILVALLVATSAFATSGGKEGVPLPADTENLLNQSAVHASQVRLGTQVTQKKVNVLKAVYNHAVLGGGQYAWGSSVILRDAAGGQAVLPKNAIIQKVIIHTLTAVQGVNVAIGANTVGDIYPMKRYSTLSGIQTGIQDGSTALMSKIGGAKTSITASFGDGSASAGKFNVFIEYLLSD